MVIPAICPSKLGSYTFILLVQQLILYWKHFPLVLGSFGSYMSMEHSVHGKHKVEDHTSKQEQHTQKQSIKSKPRSVGFRKIKKMLLFSQLLNIEF